jgi:hypothetical protein
MTDPRISLIRGAETLSLHDLAGVTIRLDEDGLGLPPVRRLVERGPGQNGDTDIGYRLEPRIINLALLIATEEPTAYWTARRALQRFLAPSTIPLSLRYVLPTSETRQIDVAYAGGLTWAGSERLVTAHTVGVQLRAADPTFYDPTPRSLAVTISPAPQAWDIPWAIPWSIGNAGEIDSTATEINTGDWAAYPIITIIGPLTSVVITNQTTGDVLDFSGLSIAASEIVTIDTRPGVKSVTTQSGVNRISALSDDSDLATFRIAAHPDAASGLNVLTFRGGSGAASTSIELSYQPRYSAL